MFTFYRTADHLMLKPLQVESSCSLIIDHTGTDFSNMVLAFIFNDESEAGTTSCQSVAIFDDNLIEEDEKFLLSINVVQNDPVSGGSSACVTIVDVNGISTHNSTVVLLLTYCALSLSLLLLSLSPPHLSLSYFSHSCDTTNSLP